MADVVTPSLMSIPQELGVNIQELLVVDRSMHDMFSLPRGADDVVAGPLFALDTHFYRPILRVSKHVHAKGLRILRIPQKDGKTTPQGEPQD